MCWCVDARIDSSIVMYCIKDRCTFVFAFLRFLDLSFNHIGCIGHLEGVVSLKKVFLIQNKISCIENLQPLINLTMLELGSNRIRVSINLYSYNCSDISFSLALRKLKAWIRW